MNRSALKLIIGLAAAFYATFLLRTGFQVGGEWFFTLRDDPMISMRFARNLADGHGLVWNPGGERVEGYTNFLWIVWMSLFHLFPIPESKIALVVGASAGGLLLLNIFLVWEIVRRIADHASAVVAAILTGFSYPLVYWTLRGMEIGLLLTLVNLALLLAIHWREQMTPRRLAIIAAVLAVSLLIRPDAVVPAGIVGAGVVSILPSQGRVRTAVVIAGLAITVLMAHTLFRIFYYGDPLPNTFYLKLTGVTLGERMARGWEVLVPMLKTHLEIPILLALPSLKRIRDPIVGTLWAFFLSHVFYSLYVGGDAWEFFGFANRYLTVGTSALFILAGVSLAEIRGQIEGARASDAWDRRLVAACVVGLLAVALFGFGDAMSSRYLPWYRFVRMAVAVGSAAGAILIVVGFRVGGNSGGERRPIWIHRAFAVTVVAAGWAGTSLSPIAGQWVPWAGAAVVSDNAWARLGMVLEEATTTDASLLLTAGGNVSYFSHRETLDMLGKTDPVVARTAARGEFLPGHDKWDYEHSVGTVRPDVIVTLWSPTLDDYEYIWGQGYTDVGSLVEPGRNYCFDYLDGEELPCLCQDGSFPHGVICGLMFDTAATQVDRNVILRHWRGTQQGASDEASDER